MDHKKIVYTSGRWFLPKKSKKWLTKNSIHFWEMFFPQKVEKWTTGFYSKCAKVDHKKIVYTSGRWVLPQKVQKWTTKNSIHFWEMGFSSKSAKMDHKRKYTLLGHVFSSKSRKMGHKNSIHFSDRSF